MWEGAPLDTLESIYIEYVPIIDTEDFLMQMQFTTTIVIDSLTLSQIDSGLVTTVLENL